MKKKKKEDEIKEEKKNREKMEQERKETKSKEMKPYFKNRRKILKEQFINIKSKQNELKKEREEEEKKEAEKYKRKEYIVSDREKNYNEFEKNINNTLKKISEQDSIKGCLDKYMNHLKIIYDIYSKIGYNKISFYSKEVMHIDEFKQFLINFAILGIYINSEQMNWIFKNIAKISQKERNNELYFDFEDFKLSIFYLTIFSKYEIKTWKMKPKDIEEMSDKNIQNFLQNLGLKLPFNKVELEKFINERRSMTMKNMLSLQHSKKLEEAKNYINNNKNNNEINGNNNNIDHNDLNNEEKNKNQESIINNEVNQNSNDNNIKRDIKNGKNNENKNTNIDSDNKNK